MYELLHNFSIRPEPFSRYSAKQLWTRPHLAEQMLNFHLCQESALASRPLSEIEKIVDWIDASIPPSGKKLCDLGCGPGLYAGRFAAKGATVTGIDFSGRAIAYAESHTCGNIQYMEADYLIDSLPQGFDLVTLIYTDLCALSADQRKTLLTRIRKMLKPEGHVVLDVVAMAAFAQREESTTIEDRLMNGFWAAGAYVGLQKSYLYRDSGLALDRFLIVEPDQQWEIFNWTQYFTAAQIEDELAEAGFAIEQINADLIGTPLHDNAEMIGIIARAI